MSIVNMIHTTANTSQNTKFHNLLQMTTRMMQHEKNKQTRCNCNQLSAKNIIVYWERERCGLLV